MQTTLMMNMTIWKYLIWIQSTPIRLRIEWSLTVSGHHRFGLAVPEVEQKIHLMIDGFLKPDLHAMWVGQAGPAD
jgi:hypothetical protein